MSRPRSQVFSAAFALLVGAPLASPVAFGQAASLKTRGEITFERSVLPVLRAHCAKCHGQGKLEGGLDVRQSALLLRGGDSGPAVSPGQPNESLLLEKIKSREMPPKPEPALSLAEESLIREWVAGGARSVPATRPGKVEPASSVSEAARRFWAFQRPVRPNVPTVRHPERVRTPIDAFLLARLEANGLSFNRDAPRNVLLRRMSIDLVGLPPTPRELDEFTADTLPGAYERLVDRLLASPQYGERWARAWLDVAGYADSDGYLAADRERLEAWRYRDYVIESHNADLPFDRFALEQLAGDEISGYRTAKELSPETVRQLTATGFLRTALDPTYPGYAEPNEIHQVLSDTMQIVGSTFLGLTVQCARCHAHKFDPISQRDYYSLQAVFLPALDPSRWRPSGDRGIPLATAAEVTRIRRENDRINGNVQRLRGALNKLTDRFRRRRVNELVAAHLGKTTPGAGNVSNDEKIVVDRILAALTLRPKKRSEEQRRLIAEYLPGGAKAVTEESLAAHDPEYQTESARFKAELARFEASRPALTLLRGLMDLEEPFPSGRILLRGDFNKPGGVVEPNVPAVLVPAGFRFEPQRSDKTSGRRAALARWLVDPSHPLTARVQVNRIWSRHFGRGLVSTLANFGHSGALPTHPELLDWLATEYIRRGWSTKALHRLVVTSTVYRQTAEVEPATAAADPDNLLLGAWQPRRFEGEVLRDSVLAVAGALNPAMLGPPSPVQALADGSVLTGNDAAGRRRSIYLKVRRSQHVTMLDLFDTPAMEVNCPQRNVSTVPLQALAMLHGPFVEENAASLADRLLKSAGTDAGRLDLACRLVYSRRPGAGERAAILAFVQRMKMESAAVNDGRRAADAVAWTQAALVLLNSNAFVYVE